MKLLHSGRTTTSACSFFTCRSRLETVSRFSETRFPELSWITETVKVVPGLPASCSGAESGPGALQPFHNFLPGLPFPFPDEDDNGPGNYEPFRGLRLNRLNIDFSDPETVDYPGIIQLKHDCGMLANIPCYHGEKLPDTSSIKDLNIFWNGRSWFYELDSIKNTDNGIMPVVKCRHCRSMWSYSWDEILPYITDKELKKRLEKYNQ